ncbi:hypothetical protein [Methylotenera sp.]|uniref:hypothetical protein n=1 Tax=Methylotenera sp. TaxID=2051956 RepID=UPI0024872474|nr:hypothetical protein [Methylotenera sp.]MDI1361062.1 hypothetical protein [Methylotenera sp.]
MSLSISLSEIKSRVMQCDNLIANTHLTNRNGAYLFSAIDRQQITVAAFLNLFIAWESFLEDTITKLMSGSQTISGRLPNRYVVPPNQDAAKALVLGCHRYFDYANFDNVKRIVLIYFEMGYPFEPHLSSITNDLADLRTMRNASAHITTTTQKALEALAQRVFSTPQPNIDLYTLLTTSRPTSLNGNTLFAESRDKLLVTAELIANG